MSAQFKILEDLSLDHENEQFGQDILHGLKHSRKHISSKYFYDAKGSQLFNEITRHPDYYLTNSEIEIIQRYKQALSNLFQDKPFNLIELGPGEGIKTRLLIDQFLQDNRKFSYFTIDISEKYLNQIVRDFNLELPNLNVTALNGDYFKGLKWLNHHSTAQNLVLFLGSSIGNFEEKDTHFFLHNIWQDLHNEDYLLIGFDLRKPIDILLKAYSDSAGITRNFNLNLLTRINNELDANFDVSKFEHYATYNPYKGAMESYLLSTAVQNVDLSLLNECIHFGLYEPLHLEFSYKYTLTQINHFAKKNGFTIVENFYDAKGYFLNSLWKVNKS